MNEFVDTNVIVYAYDADALQKHEASIELISRLDAERTGTLSIQVLVEFYNAALRKLRMKSEAAEEGVRDLSRWKLHRPDHASIPGAIRLEQRYKLAWCDAMILNSAIEAGCSTLWTEDFHDDQRFGDLTVRNPYKNARSV